MSAFASPLVGTVPDYQPNPPASADPFSQISGALQNGVGRIFNQPTVPTYGAPVAGVENKRTINPVSVILIALIILVIVAGGVALSKK